MDNLVRNEDGLIDFEIIDGRSNHLFDEDEREYNESLPDDNPNKTVMVDDIPVGIYENFSIPLKYIFDF